MKVTGLILHRGYISNLVFRGAKEIMVSDNRFGGLDKDIAGPMIWMAII